MSCKEIEFEGFCLGDEGRFSCSSCAAVDSIRLRRGRCGKPQGV